MKRTLVVATCCLIAFVSPATQPVPLFNGKSLDGWEGNPKLWRVENGTITGGSSRETIKENDFLCTKREFADFVLRLKFKLTGAEGFINSGVQIRSKRVPNSSELAGYQCDLGDPDWWGAIYDEARRNRVLFPTDMVAVNEVLHRNDWNDYMIRAEGPRITVWLNGVRTADYYEDDTSISQRGVIGIQVHGGGKTIIQVKDVMIEELPTQSPKVRFVGAPAPPKSTKASPLSPADAKAAFTVPPGFEIELVASEEQGVTKPITVVWDAKGRMWTMTALEYPVDANDNKEIAEALYKQPRRDKVLVFDNPYGPGPIQPRVFADGLAIPLGLLPYKDGAFVQHGSDILFLRDTDGDGKADAQETILTGFGIGDSHLLPHQFTRAPGGWIMFAQGAFNNSNVRTKSGEVHEFNRTLMGRFTPDGNNFETIGWGPCNIWGLVLDGEGEAFIQEANDYGYPVMPFHVGACYPGCTPFPKPYAPTFPGLSRLGMGGTGLSGLAYSDEHGSFPGPYAGVFYVANPVKQRIQAVKLFRDGSHYSLLKLPDFVLSSDEWFRPVAIHFGPDGCLYIVDWCNKVISHNEVPRNHPDRDKTRGRIWRVRHKDQKPRKVPDFTKVPERELLSYLGGESLWQSQTAWQQLADRHAATLTRDLEKMARDHNRSGTARIQALWTLEGLKRIPFELLPELLSDSNRNIRREAVRVLAAANLPEPFFNLTHSLTSDPDPDVRAELIRSAGKWIGKDDHALELLLTMAREALSSPVAKNTQNGQRMKVRDAYDREFERYLVRWSLEKYPAETQAFLASDAASKFPLENRLLAALALEPKTSASLVARLLPELKRAPNDEELLRLAEHLEEPGVEDALKAVLKNPAMRVSATEALLRGRTRFDTSRLAPIVTAAAKEMFNSTEVAAVDLIRRLASGFKLRALEPQLLDVLKRPGQSASEQVQTLRALREIGSERADTFSSIAIDTRDSAVRDEAIAALIGAGAADRVWELWPKLNVVERRSSLERMAGSKSGAEAILASVKSGSLSKQELEAPVLEKMMTLLGDHHDSLNALLADIGAAAKPVLRLDGHKESYVESGITLEGPFTVETWIRLDPGISNDDGILGRPGGADFNFFDGRLRVYGGPEHGDRIIAKRKMTPDLWTHVGATRDADGNFKIYVDGELDQAECRPLKDTFSNLDIGRVAIAKGTGALLAEYRIWNRCRTADEIRADFDRSFEGSSNEVGRAGASAPHRLSEERETYPSGLVKYFPGGTSWGRLMGSARIVRTLDPPPVLTAQEARIQSEKLAKYRSLAERRGDTAHGKQLSAACLVCHTIQAQGGNIGPNLSGAGAMNLEALLRSILTPNAAMEAGYRTFRVELNNDEILDGFLVSQDANAVLLRIPNSEDRRIPKTEIRRSYFIRRSLMPEGLLESLPDRDVTDLLAYLRSLK